MRRYLWRCRRLIGGTGIQYNIIMLGLGNNIAHEAAATQGELLPGGLNLDGVGDWLGFGRISESVLRKTHTVSYWVRFNNSSSLGPSGSSLSGASDGSDVVQIGAVAGGGFYSAFRSNGASVATIFGSGYFTADGDPTDWILLTYTIAKDASGTGSSGSRWRAYWNGDEKVENTTINSMQYSRHDAIDANRSFNIGSVGDNADFAISTLPADAHIAEVAIWDQELSGRWVWPW